VRPSGEVDVEYRAAHEVLTVLDGGEAPVIGRREPGAERSAAASSTIMPPTRIALAV
jgi:hypothetical protein